MSVAAFFPIGTNLVLAGGAASVGNALTGTETVVRVVNLSAGAAFFKSGVGAQTAAATDTPLAPNSVELFRIHPTHTHVAVIIPGDTGNVHFQRGEGV